MKRSRIFLQATAPKNFGKISGKPFFQVFCKLHQSTIWGIEEILTKKTLIIVKEMHQILWNPDP